MILEIDDKRELKLSDDVTDDVARQLKKLILAVEDRAAREKRLDILEGQVADLTKKLAETAKPKAPKVVKRKKYGSRK